MRANSAALLLGVATACAGCGNGNDSTITIHAPDQSVAVFANGTWSPIRLTDGVGAYTPDGPFAIAAICDPFANLIEYGGVHVVLGGPGDVTETSSSCRASSPSVSGTVEIVGPNPVLMHVGHKLPWGQSTGSMTLPSGRHDLVAYDNGGDRWVILHDVDVAEGFAIRLDFSSPAHMAERPGSSRFSLETKNGTVAYGGSVETSFAADALAVGDRQSAIRVITPIDEREQHEAFVRLDVGPDAPLGGVPAWTARTVGDVHIRGAGGRIEAQWTSDGLWTTRTVNANVAGVQWHVEAHDGWDDGSGTVLRTPDLAMHPAWDDRLSVRRVGASLELAERFNAYSEGVVWTQTAIEALP
jgi:hypothetical protein